MLASGFLVVMTSVVALGAVTLAKLPTRAPFAMAATELCMIRLNVENAVSASSRSVELEECGEEAVAAAAGATDPVAAPATPVASASAPATSAATRQRDRGRVADGCPG